jgi:hypothetical protein
VIDATLLPEMRILKTFISILGGKTDIIHLSLPLFITLVFLMWLWQDYCTNSQAGLAF